jgi:hypothetical protein
VRTTAASMSSAAMQMSGTCGLRGWRAPSNRPDHPLMGRVHLEVRRNTDRRQVRGPSRNAALIPPPAHGQSAHRPRSHDRSPRSAPTVSADEVDSLNVHARRATPGRTVNGRMRPSCKLKAHISRPKPAYEAVITAIVPQLPQDRY